LLFFSFLLIIVSCTSAQQYQNHEQELNDFYLGLLIPGSNDEKIKLFENSLSSSNMYMRQAAAGELAVLMYHGAELSVKTMNIIRREASGWWAGAFDSIGTSPDKNKALSFLLGFEQNSPLSFNEARFYALQEYGKQGIVFSNNEMAAIDGHFAVARLRYSEALIFFRNFRTEDAGWPEQIPEIFIMYPNLINDLGRAFQYTQSGNEGLVLFQQWERNLTGEIAGADDIRYRLLFFAARVARRMGQNAQALSLFEQSLILAPDQVQRDACIWYILDLSMTGSADTILDRLEILIPRMNSISTINDIMERFLHRLVSAQDWRRIIRTFNLIKDKDGSGLKAGFAWVIARAIEEGYLSEEERSLAALAANVSSADVSAFMQIAYNAGNTLIMPAVYYRMQSSGYLGLPFLEFSEVSDDNETPSQALQFILGFYNNNAVSFSVPYIRSMESGLSPVELRTAANALDEAGMYPQSMRLISVYINREGYAGNRRDLELMFPRPYLDLAEIHSQMFNIHPSLLYGLIRTESAFQSAVVSHAGAVGLMQLMPATALDMAQRILRGGGPDFIGPGNRVDSTNPETNIYIGSYYINYLRNYISGYLRDRHESDQDDQIMLMSYNGGMSRVRNWRNTSTMPVDLFVETAAIYETRDYGRRVPAFTRVYEELYYK